MSDPPTPAAPGPDRPDRTDETTRTTRSDGASARARPHARTRVIAMMNQKGGVGKTTTTVNLASGIAESGRDVLLIDLDPQAHATYSLGTDPDELDASVYDVLLEKGIDASGVREAIVSARDRLDLLPAVTDLAGAETELANEADRATRLRGALSQVRSEYEFVFIDCPPSLGTLTLNGLACAREVIVPMQAHFLALQGVGKLLETVSLVGRGVNPALRVSGVILTMHDEQSRHSREVVDDIKSFFEGSKDRDVPWRGAKVYTPAVRRNIKLAESPSFGQSIFEYAPSSNGAKDYGALTESVVAEWDRLLERMASQQVEAKDAGATPAPETVS